MTETLASAKRLIVKIGSALLVDGLTGDIRRGWLESISTDIAHCRARGQEVLIVSSGAVAVGRRHLGLTGHALRLEFTDAFRQVGDREGEMPQAAGLRPGRPRGGVGEGK